MEALSHIFLLVRYDDLLQEVLVKALIREVDAQLLKPVGRHVLKAEYIQNTDRVRSPVVHSVVLCLGTKTGVDGIHDFVEEPRVEDLRKGITMQSGLGGRQILVSERCLDL